MQSDKILFHCSSLGKLMVEPRAKSETLSETTKTHLVNVYVEHVYGRKKDISNKYMEKGNAVEEDSLTLYSRLKKTVYFKNKETLTNEFIIGTPDTGEHKEIRKSKLIVDTKSSWDLFTHYASKTSPTNKDYYWQMQGYYGLLPEAKNGVLAYCLINTPPALIYDECQKLKWKMGVSNPENEALWEKACEEIEKNMTYDDIPLSERMFEIEIPRNDEDIQRIYDRVKQCREYMNQHFFAGETLTEQLLKSVA